MFADAIEKNSKFTRSVHFISRLFGSNEVVPGTATLFFINDDGVAITCKHVAKDISKRSQINSLYQKYKDEINLVPFDENHDNQVDAITSKYGYQSDITAELKALFYDCVETTTDSISYSIINHNDYDLSIIRITNASKNLYQGHAVFAKNSSALRRGDFLCRIGYPFPEFSNYTYDTSSDSIEWTQEGRISTPPFPIEGMFTREVASGDKTFAYELSTPGLRGQSGGPLFDKNGIIYGMQSVTTHLPLGFDQYNAKVRINGVMTEVENHPFLHVGRCICVDVIKEFLNDNHIKYYVDDGNGGEEVVNG